MRVSLHLVMGAEPIQATAMAEEQQQPGTEVIVVDMKREQIDYDELVRKIFAADIVRVW